MEYTHCDLQPHMQLKGYTTVINSLIIMCQVKAKHAPRVVMQLHSS